MTRLLHANILTAFSDCTIGTKVTDYKEFERVAIAAIEKFDFAGQRVPGQGFIPCDDLIPYVSAGVGARTQDPNDYVARLYRGNVELFLRRDRAAKVTGAALVVYTREAYLADPDVRTNESEQARVATSDATHILVAVLAFAGPKAPLTPTRLVHNLAGGNNEAAGWTADEIRAKAEEVKQYWDEWVVVAD